MRFANGDNNTKYQIKLDFTQQLLDRNNVVVPMNDCRKTYMVFAPRFEQAETELEDDCFLTAGVGPTDTTWQVGDSSKLTGARYFIGTPDLEERVQLLSVVSPTQITVARGYQSSAPGTWSAGARMKKLSAVNGFASDVEWGCTISNISVTGDGSLKVGGGSARIEESIPDYRLLGGLQVRRGGLAIAVVEHGPRQPDCAHQRRGCPEGVAPLLADAATRSASRNVPEHRLWQGRGQPGWCCGPRIAVRSLPERVRRHHGEPEGCQRSRGRNPYRGDHRSL
jgi:hypothetical protein